jgi:hypothetical protein
MAAVETAGRTARRLVGGWAHRGEEAGEGETLVAGTRQVFVPDPPAIGEAPLLDKARFILEPEGQPLGGVSRGENLPSLRAPCFLNAAWASASGRGGRGRVFLRDEPMRLTRDMHAG